MATHLTISHGTSRGADTYGYPIVSLRDDNTGKRYRTMGGGYDMVGTVFAKWLQETHQDALMTLADQAYYRTSGDGLQVNENGLYGMFFYVKAQSVRLDGACGLESMVRIAKPIGLSVQRVSNQRGHLVAFVVTED